ncbi:MAG: type II toxin-antitoxin system VapC family toxin [Cyanobium sp. Prado107]|nr:type II toxin-antitoxin system VapC family toxin [Cyanobium sp. Prado107]
MTAEARPREACHVLDASALLRLYLADGPLPANLEAVMERGCRGEGLLLVPDLCWLEMTSVVGKQVVRGLLSPGEAEDLLDELLQLPLRTAATADLCLAALRLSQQLGLSVYDASYLALALRHGALLISADARLAAAALRSGCGG